MKAGAEDDWRRYLSVLNRLLPPMGSGHSHSIVPGGLLVMS
jgi:hypothetical protein